MTRKEILEFVGEGAVLLEGAEHDRAFIGVTDDGRAVYSFGKLREWLMEHDGMSIEEATEFVEFNTIRALPYMGPMAPVIVYLAEEEK